MSLYQIIETDDGLAVAETQPGATPEEVAAAKGALLIPPNAGKRLRRDPGVAARERRPASRLTHEL
jgi:hypothetical protein